MAIQREFVLRYLKGGHVRFQVPVGICGETIADKVTDEIYRIDGVYRVQLYRRQQKLSIHFQEAFCDFKSLAKQLFALLETLEKKGALTPESATQAEKKAKGFWAKKAFESQNQGIVRWVKDQYGAAKETVQAAKVITRLGLKKPQALVKDPEKAIIDFLNDILVLFLIKLHWQTITQQWIVKPLKYRYEWMAVFYMFYLLIRSRKAK